MKRILLAALFLTLCLPASAQKIRAERQENGNVTFILEEKTRPGTLTVLLTLSDLSNCYATAGVSKYEVQHSDMPLLSLRPANPAQGGVGYRYNYRLFHGKIDPQADTAFVYRIPLSTSKPTRIFRGFNVLDHNKSIDKRERLGLHCMAQKGDTVYAMRRGVVVEVEIVAPRDPNAPEVTYSSENSSLIIEHPDGSFARYSVLDGEHILIREGDQVLPSTPLALVGSHDRENYKVVVNNYWFITNPDKAESENKPYIDRRFFPSLATDTGVIYPEQGSYTPACSEQMICSELSKKELKQRLGNKKK